MNEYLEEWNQTDSSRFDVIKPILVEHLENLITEFDCYLPVINLETHLWVRNPFLVKVDNLSEDVAGLQEELIDLHDDSSIDNFYPQHHLESSGPQLKRKSQ